MSNSSEIEDRNSVRVALISLVKGIFWPAFAIIFILHFSGQLNNMLEALSLKMRSANSIDLGGYVKVTIQDQIVSPPSPEVAKVLANLNTTSLRSLLEHGTDNGTWICFGGKTYSEQTQERIFNDLDKAGLIRVDDQPFPGQVTCAGKYKLMWFSDAAKETKLYFLSTLLGTIKFSPTTNQKIGAGG